MGTPRHIGREFDVLARPHLTRLDLARLDLAKPDRVIDDPPTKRICVVTSIRNEGIALLEWVAHYRVLGFESIIVYSNDNTDHSEDLLSALAYSDVIHLCWNEVASDVSAQMKAYRHALLFNPEVAQHEWVFLLDADEFVIPCIEGQPATNVRDWLDVIERNCAPSGIYLNWKWFSGYGDFEKSDGLCMERFRDAKENAAVKTLFKIRDAVNIFTPHAPVLRPQSKQIDGNGDPAALGLSQTTPAYRYGQINHYWNKSFQEFFIRRQRGIGFPPGQRAFGDWFRFGRALPDFPQPWPTSMFIQQVKDEVARLCALPGVADAERKAQARFREMQLENGGAREAYETTLGELRNAG